MTPFSLLLQLSGLTQREAATFLDSREDTVRSWSLGRRNAPPGVIEQMRDLIDRQEEAAVQAIRQIEAMSDDMTPDEIEIGYPADDHEAQELGFPTVSAWGAMAARVIADIGADIRLVPRGSTATSAKAADAHNR